jgi:uncharacterized protein
MNLRERLRSMQGTARTAFPAGAPGNAAPPPAPDTVDASDAPDAPDVALPGPSPAPTPTDALGPALATRTPPFAAAPPSRHGPESLLPGSVHETPYGSCFVAEWRYPYAHRHGFATLDAATRISPGDGAALLTRVPEERATLAALDPCRVVYLDIETTGLAGGTGTYAFLVGVARFTGGALVVRQLFMRELAEERAVLHLLGEELSSCDVLVTFNGKAFDWPLLETRYALVRRIGPRLAGAPAAHLDLLFAARRLWRPRLESCALAQVEREVLGVRRGEDTPGWLIPQLYFAYLRSRDARPLVGVFRHNALDLLSLAGLLGHVAGIARLAERAEAADELLALGRCFEEAGDLSRALTCYQSALDAAEHLRPTLRRTLSRAARVRAGTLLKRLRRSSDALAHWEALLEAQLSHGMGQPNAIDIRPYEEIAKHYEHVARDHATARTYVDQALALLDMYSDRGARRDRARLLHRLARLDRILATQSRSD